MILNKRWAGSLVGIRPTALSAGALGQVDGHSPLCGWTGLTTLKTASWASAQIAVRLPDDLDPPDRVPSVAAVSGLPEWSAALRGVDWASLGDAHGAAGDLPGILLAVWSDDPAACRGAYRALAGRLVHQGSRYEASAVAAGFLIDVVADPAAPDRFAACQVLRMIAIGDESYWLTELPDIAAVRREVARQATLTLAELEHEQSMWVAAAGDEDERRGRESAARYSSRSCPPVC
ncbi:MULTISPECIES: hypothetical protein [unclassified Solwaraspora]|uniref:hypothetical protein n=1 Tax=unclassified Solwaraspora TaxID=2627926 RepID=UPI00259B2530|nr:hypothetical protein [Solwaraspora sp. WMMA2056]WJK41365.1 hypothetical protein O7608_02710 [Solwaraspora sp. WMMA2056]